MKYYVVYVVKTVGPSDWDEKRIPVCVVQDEEIAKDLCKKFGDGHYYREETVGVEKYHHFYN